MKTLTVEFEDVPGEYVVRTSPVPVDALFAVEDAASRWPTPEGMDALKAAFGPYIVAWPLDGDPSPERLGELDLSVLLALVREWTRGVVQVPLPLPVRSSGGAPSGDTPESPNP